MGGKFTKITALFLMIILAFGMIETSFAASAKKPGTPRITSAKANGTNVTISWTKARNAGKYQVAIRTDSKVWVKYKTVAKSRKNKKKYTKPGKYRVKAKGKKYVVYKYAYKYEIEKIVKKNTVKFSRLKSNTDYTFAVRSVNGNKYSKWKKVSIRTGVYSERVIINGKSLLVSEGQPVTLPLPNIPGVSINKSSVSIIPKRDDWYDFYDKEEGTVRIYGKDPEGFSAYYVYYPGYYFICGRQMFSTWDEREKYGYLSYGSEHMGWPEVFTIHMNAENMKAVWTLDGTEPQYDQEALEIDASEYPFGPWTKNDRVQTRGSTTGPGNTVVYETKWTDNKGWGVSRSAPIAVWAKLYHNNTLIEEYIVIDMQ